MKSFAGFFFFSILLYGQTCAPADALRPTDTVRGAISDANCRLPDGTFYAAYSLVLPTRGRLELESEFPLILRDAEEHKIDAGTAIRRPAERGPYTVLVTGGPGEFSLRSAFTPEPNTLCRDFPHIGLNETVAARLTDTSCRLPDGTLFDAYRLDAFSAGTLEVSLDAGEILVRNGEGHLLASDQGKVSVTLRGDESYTILATAAQPREYKLALNFAPAGGDPCRPAAALDGPAQVRGTAIAGCVLTLPGADSPLPFRQHEVKVPEAGAAELRVSSNIFDPLLYLLDSSGNVIQTDVYSGGRGLAIVRQQLRPGSYTLLVVSLLARGGDYTLQYSLRPGLPETCPLLEMQPGTATAGSVSAASCRTVEGIADVYRIVLPASGRFDVAILSEEFDTLLVLRDEQGNRLVLNDDIGEETNSRIIADLPAGTYTVAAATRDAPGAYTIGYQLTPRELKPCEQVRKMEPNSAFLAVLGANSCRAANGQPIDYYEFTTPSDGTVAAVMTSSEVDSFLTIEDTQGNVLRWDDNSYGYGDAIAVQYLPAGAYRLGARGANLTFRALYRVDALFSPGERPPGCMPLRTLAPGDVIAGTLSYTSCEYPGDTFADWYRLDLDSPAGLQIGLESGQFDAYLVLLDARGNVVDEDDNSGGETNSLIASNLNAGTYYVVVKPFSDSLSVGAYALGISAIQ